MGRIVQQTGDWSSVEFPRPYQAVLRPAPGARPSRVELLLALQEASVAVYDLHSAGATVEAELRAWHRELTAAPVDRQRRMARELPPPPPSPLADRPGLERLLQLLEQDANGERWALDARLTDLFAAVSDHAAIRELRMRYAGPGGAAEPLAVVLQAVELRAIRHYLEVLTDVARDAGTQAQRARRIGDDSACRQYRELERRATELVAAFR